MSFYVGSSRSGRRNLKRSPKRIPSLRTESTGPPVIRLIVTEVPVEYGELFEERPHSGPGRRRDSRQRRSDESLTVNFRQVEVPVVEQCTVDSDPLVLQCLSSQERLLYTTRRPSRTVPSPVPSLVTDCVVGPLAFGPVGRRASLSEPTHNFSSTSLVKLT